MAIAAKWLAAHYNSQASSCSTQRLRHLQRRRPDGGHQQRGRLDRRASQARNLCWIYDNNHITIEGKTDLAFDRRRRHPLHRPRLARDSRRRRQRSGGPRKRLQRLPRTKDRPTFIIVKTHRLRRTDARHAEAHGDPLGDEEIRMTKEAYGWPAMPSSSCRPKCRNTSMTRSESTARNSTANGSSYPRSTKEVSRAGDELTLIQENELPDRLGQGPPNLPSRRKGNGHADFGRQSPKRPGQEHSLAPGRLGRSRPVHEDFAHLRRSRRQPFRREPWRPQYAFRHSRTWHGRRRQRHDPLRARALSAPRSSSSATTAAHRSASPR